MLRSGVSAAHCPRSRPGCLRPQVRTGSIASLNPGRPTSDAHGPAGRYRRGMQAVRRFAGGDPGMITDAGIGIVAAGLIAAAVCKPPGLVGATPIVGPSWLLALLPLLMGAPLML